MKCPSCGAIANRVIDSRLLASGEATRRRRVCDACERRFTTYERVEESLPLVVKKDGRRETYERRKVLLGIERACQKRPVSAQDREQIANDIERVLLELSEREIASSWIGEQVMHHLREIDQVAYVRFASVYRSFEDIGEFLSELSKLTERGKRIANKSDDPHEPKAR
jgi:transcriptional repressor NrdR